MNGVFAAQNDTCDDIINDDVNDNFSNNDLDNGIQKTIPNYSIHKSPKSVKSSSSLKNIYVSKNGSDLNSGTKNSPKSSLKSAVNSIANGGTIYLSNGIYSEHGIYINKNISVIGQNSRNTIIDCSGNHLFTISTNTRVTFKTFSIKNAYDTYGGAIYNKGSLSLQGMRLYSNKAKYGAGIYNKGVLTIHKTSFTSNYASYGSCIYNLNYLKVSKSTFLKNDASQVGSAIASKNKIDLNNCNFTGNKNSAIFLDNIHKYSYIHSSIFIQNSGINGACIFNKDSILSVNKTYFKSNKASKYGAVLYSSGITGIKLSSILNNNAYDGIIYSRNYTSVSYCIIKNNTASNYGGVIFSLGRVSLSYDNITNNTANIGGVLYSNSNANNNIAVKSCNILSNKAHKYASVIYLTGRGILDLRLSTISYNNNKAIYIKNTANRHLIYNCSFTKNSGDTGSVVYNEKSILNISKCIISSNNASVHGNIYNYMGKVNVTYSVLKNNRNIDVYNNKGTCIANYDWWCSNNQPSKSRVYQTTVNNWIYLRLDVESANVNEKTNITMSINNAYAGGKLYKINGGLLPKLELSLSINGCGVSKTYNPRGNNPYSTSISFLKTGDVKIMAYAYNEKVQKVISIKSRLFTSKITSLFVQIGASVSSSDVKGWTNAGITDIYVQSRASTSDTAKLTQVINLCKNTNIRVHAWIICFSTNNGFDIGTSQQNMIKNFIKKVIKINGVDGVCLDYVRYSGSNANAKSSVITAFVKNVNSIVKDYDNSLIVSACVFAEKEATKIYYGQDYAALSPYVDVMLPMAYKYDYNSGRNWLKSVTSYVVSRAKYSKVVTVLQSYKETGGGYVRLSKSELEEDARAVMSAGSYGYSLFRYGLISSYPKSASKL